MANAVEIGRASRGDNVFPAETPKSECHGPRDDSVIGHSGTFRRSIKKIDIVITSVDVGKVSPISSRSSAHESGENVPGLGRHATQVMG